MAAVAAILFSFLIYGIPAAAYDPYIIFKPIATRSDSSVDKWKSLGVSQRAAEALHTYATNPTAGNALGVLNFYNDFAGDPEVLASDPGKAEEFKKLRIACFDADRQLFQSIDGAKYEVVMRTQQRLAAKFKKQGGIEAALRVGSSAKQHKLWLDWAKTGKKMDSMPPLNPNKQFSSDDDITNFPSSKAAEADPALAELVNGATAADEFVEASKKMGYTAGLDPKKAQIEFLSPTKAYNILRIQHPGEYVPVKPRFMAEWTRSDQEKYNGLFAVEQLHKWAMEKGMITTDINDPKNSTMAFSHYNNKAGDASVLKGFSEDGLFGWMANNHRQIFHVHNGDLKSLAKYTSRMIAAWRALGLTPPKGDQAMYDLSVSIYDPPENFKPPADALDTLLKYNRTLIVEGHKQNLQVIARHLSDTIQSLNTGRPVDRGLNFIPFKLEDLMGQNKELKKAVNALAVAYTNIDSNMIQDLEIEIGKQIKQAEQNLKQVKYGGGYAAHMSAFLLQTVETAKKSAATSKAHADAFVYLRGDLNKSINEHIEDVALRLNLDAYLLKVATGDFKKRELRIDWNGKRPVIARRILTPDDVAKDMRWLESMARLFKWEEAPLATRAKEYFEAKDPDLAVRMVQLLREMAEAKNAKPVTIEYKDADGNIVHEIVEASKFQAGLNAGFLAFKAALKGWKIWGDVSDGKALYENLEKITQKAGLSPSELAVVQAQALSNFLSLLDYFQAGKFTHNVPLGGTLATLATLSGNAFQDDSVFTDLGIALFKDLAVMHQQWLIYAYALHGIGSWGYNKYSVHYAKEAIFDLLIENGKWDIDDMKPEDRKRVKDPKLIEYYVRDGKGYEVPEKDTTQLAKLLTGKVHQGIMLKESKYLVNPRESLLNIAYGSGYVGKDPMLDITTKAINDLYGVSMIKLPIMLTNLPIISSGSRDWTKWWLKDSYGLLVPTHEDDLKIRKMPLIQFTGGSDYGWGTWAASWTDSVKFGVLRNLGVLMQDFWVKRQILIEKVILPDVLKEAARRKMREDVQSADIDNYLDEVKKLKERLKELDKKVWDKAIMARSTDPFTGPKYDPEKDIPITNLWWKNIEPLRKDLVKCVVWVKTYKNDKNADPTVDFPNDYLTSLSDAVGFASWIASADYASTFKDRAKYAIQVQTADDVEKRARLNISLITDVLLATEKAYDNTLKILDDTKKEVTKLGKFDISPYHVQLKPSAAPSWNSLASTPEEDTKIAEKWQDQWKKEKLQVSFDIGSILVNMGYKPSKDFGFDWQLINDIFSSIESFQSWLTSAGPDVDIAKFHPLWPQCVQLRLQIHKLKNMLTNVSEISSDELKTGTKGMILKEVVKKEQKDKDKNKQSAANKSKTADVEEIKDVPVKVGETKTPADRQKKINELIREMEADYVELLALVRELFNLEITVSPNTGLHLAKEIEVKVTVKPKKFGPKKEEIEKIVKNFRFEIYGKEPGVSEGDLIVNEIVKEGKWKHHLSAAGKQTLRVQAMGVHHMPFSTIEEDLTADPAYLKGDLVVHGDFSGQPPFELKFGKESFLIHSMDNLYKSGDFKVTIKRVADSLFYPPEYGKVAKPYITFGRIVDRTTNPNMVRRGGVSFMPLAESNKAPTTLTDDKFILDVPLEVTLPALVNVDVSVTDASSKPAEADVSIHSKKQSIFAPDDFVLNLMNKDLVWAMAERKDLSISDKSKAVEYDHATMQNQMAFDLKLPFFDTDNLTVNGSFVVDAPDPKPVLTGGTFRSNMSEVMPAPAGGIFSFSNNRPALLTEDLTLYALLYADDYMFKPKGGSFSKPLKEGAVFDLGAIEVVPYEVTIDPVTIKVVDKTGRTIPKDWVNAFIGHEKAVWKDDAFVGTWTIKKKNDIVDLSAVLTLPDGTTLNQIETMSADQFNLLGTPSPPPPVTLSFDVHVSVDIMGTSGIDLPPGVAAPVNITIECPTLKASHTFKLGEPFQFTLNGPIEVGSFLEIKGSAKNNKGKTVFHDSKPVKITEKTLYDLGALLLKKDSSDFVTITSMKVTSPSGKGKPVMGQTMKGAADLVVGQYEGPLAIVEWNRFSDNYKDQQFEPHVVPGQKLTVSINMPAVPKNQRTKDDVLELHISDAIDKETKGSFPFTWEMGDEFSHFRFTSIKKGKTGKRFFIGQKIRATGTWQIAKENGTRRTIVYYADGSEFSREDVRVTKGRPFKHSAVIDTKGMSKGWLDIKADLINPDPDMTATGADRFQLDEGKDRITFAGAAGASGSRARGKNYTQGDSIFINAVIEPAEGKDGLRMLDLQYRGIPVLTEKFDMKGDDKSISKAFEVNSDKLDASWHIFKLVLSDDVGKVQDRKTVRIKLAAKDQTQSQNQGGLQNVTCTGDTVNVKVWDHGSQDGDIITLILGSAEVLGGTRTRGFNLNACGGSEPASLPCAIMNLPFPAGTKVPVTIIAHNEGSASPNTASLKVEGGCTPETQHWGLKTGGRASIFIMKGKSKQQQTGQTKGSKGGGQTPTQQTIQSWP